MDILSYILSKKNSGSNPGGSTGGGSGGSSAIVSIEAGDILVDPTRTYSKLYLNTSLSSEEVNSLLAQLTANFQDMGNMLYATENEIIMVVIMGGNYAIAEMNTMTIYYSTATDLFGAGVPSFTGWNADFNGEIALTGTTLGSLHATFGCLIGVENNLITNLFNAGSNLPIKKELSGTYDGSSMNVTNNGTINISELLDQNKLPLEVNINVTNIMQQRIDLVGAQYLFYNDGGNTTMGAIDLSGLNTSKVINMSYMFYGCSVLSSPIILNTDNVTNFRFMFTGCWNIKTIDLSKYNISEYTNSLGMFDGCCSLKRLIIRSFGNYALYNDTFDTCYHITGQTNAEYNPNGDKDGYIYVPDDMVDTLKADPKWSTYATQIKSLSELPEDEQ